MVSLVLHGVMVADVHTWDVTVTDTVAPSYLAMSSACAASAAEAVAKRKEDKYIEISRTYQLLPFSFETFGSINQEFISAMGHRIIADEPRQVTQRIGLSVAIQRFNAVCYAHSFGNYCFREFVHNQCVSRLSYF